MHYPDCYGDAVLQDVGQSEMKTLIRSIILLPLSLFAQEFDLQHFIETNHHKLADTTLGQLAFDSLENDSEISIDNSNDDSAEGDAQDSESSDS